MAIVNHVRVKPEGAEPFTTTLLAFFDANDLEPHEWDILVRGLCASGRAVLGGGAAPYVEIEIIEPEPEDSP